ncbi:MULTISPECIES: ABC transporter ATP-binding protein [Bacillus]|uniref:ABC transporter ATP-binding protein n=1 Tax=Bacillus TaxID=1386 RepID=UPI000308733C|nr:MULTISPECIES: ABC transporter ATP-binding protein [Bacillus]
MSTGKRLFIYALNFKKMIILALVLLTLSVAAELAGPFVAKNIIDHHILGIQSHWYETKKGKDSVKFQGNWYKREDYFSANEEKGEKATILQDGVSFIFTKEPISLDAKIKLEGNRLTADGQTYKVTILSPNEVMNFYKPEIPRIIRLITLYFGLLVVAAFFLYFQSYFLQKSANRIIQKMRNDIFSHLSTLPIRFFDNLPAGKVVARITNDTEAIKELYVQVLAMFFSSSIYIVGIYIALFILNVKLALLCMILIPILVLWVMIYRKFASKYNQVIRARISDINAMINESIQGMNIIQAFKREKDTTEQFEKLNEEHFTYQNKMLRLNAFTSHNLVSFLQNIFLVAFIAYFGNISLSGEGVLSIGLLYAFIDYLNRLFQPIQNIVNQFANLEQALVAGNRIFELLDEKGESVSTKHIPRYKGNVTFQNVSFGYKEGDYVLKDISFSAKQGETFAFVGHTGSGKSSIMNLLFRYYDCQKGTITVDGIDIKTIPHQTLREHMGIVLQDPYLFTGTIASNVNLQDESITREMVEQALTDVGAFKVLNQVDGGMDAPVVEKGSTLSSGQRQLISFARALAFKPAVLILDEATSNIDTETEFLIQQALEILKKGRTTFIIAHRLSTIKNADCILVLDKGRIVERGTHDELLTLKGRYFNMYQMQMGTAKAIV